MIRSLIRRLRAKPVQPHIPMRACCLSWRHSPEAYWLHQVRMHGAGQP